MPAAPNAAAATPPGGASISGTVTLAPALAAKAKPDDVAGQKGRGGKLEGKGVKRTLQPHSYSMIRVGL